MVRLHKYFYATLVLTSLSACNGTGSSTTTNAVNNTVPLIVDSGYNGNANNRAFITITVCQPGTNICQSIDHVMVDSGSVGLHIASSQLTLTGLPPIEYNGNALYNCSQYDSGYNFGPMVTADIKIGGEIASNVPLSIFNDSAPSNVPSSCSNGQSLIDVASEFGAKAIMGVGVINPPNSLVYPGLYTCNSTSCTNLDSSAAINTSLVVNVISAFSQDNNGVIFNLPSVESATNTPVIGSLTFGINTQANNVPPQSLYVVNGNPNSYSSGVGPVGYFMANNGSETTPAIFDSGTPTLQFYSATIPQCTGVWAGTYCPDPSPQNWLPTVSSYNGNESIPLALSIVNYSSYFSPPAIFPGVGQVQAPSSFTSFGLPFFYGNTIYARFANGNTVDNSTPLAVGPAWGFTSNQ